MRFNDLSSKELIDLTTGSRLGVLGQTDLEIDEKTGQIISFTIPQYSMFGLRKSESYSRIDWNQIKKVGDDMIIVETEEV
ncbi:YlmC/YmxH family sporulation protein [Gracilibacillus salitolerans]|uniref:YlmC/YmxH family sporulation protein n=1 Tax=Gracilibacillus salitolerans TaxID=2663022 RepID=A0A5Q2TI75_9BACI|nr:YlmC/YmxH family sporulation protein [Gracilibacillus salitolerans]QGH34584.1 YlmC/YmxH family sporulation protein [Gracilibacillus salitolerans]